jgi:hypothetical protein
MGTGKIKVNPNSLKNLMTSEEAKEYNKRLTSEQKSERGKKGNQASQKAKRDNRTLREIALEMLAAIATEEDIKKYNLPEGVSNSVVMTAAAAQKAMAGDLKAYEILRDTAGQMPTKEVQVSAEVFTEANKALLDKVAERIKKEE